MRPLIKAKPGQASIIHAIAIGLAVEIMSGRLDSRKGNPGYVRLMDLVKAANPTLIDWGDLKKFLASNNKPSQLQEILTPILIQLNQVGLTTSLVQGRNYESVDLKELANQLSLHFMINDEPSDSNNVINLRLSKTDEGWGVRCEVLDMDHHLDQEDLIPDEEDPKPEVARSEPDKTPVASSPEVLVDIKKVDLDNPGLGNCAFYAFAIGLIHIIKHEQTFGNSDMFTLWVGVDPSMDSESLYNEICVSDPQKPSKELLDKLQTSLRLVAYQQQLKELKSACAQIKVNLQNIDSNPNYFRSLDEDSNYLKFAEIFYGNATNENFNQFLLFDEIKNKMPSIRKKIDIEVAVQIENPGFTAEKVDEIERRMIAETFIKLIYGEDATLESIDEDTQPVNNSPIIKGMLSVTKDFFWGTHLDLNNLARVFNVNFHPLQNGVARQEFRDMIGKHTVAVNNHHNAHWTTQVSVAKILSPVTPGEELVAKQAPDKPTQPVKDKQPAQEEQAAQVIPPVQPAAIISPVNDDAETLKTLKRKVNTATDNYLKHSEKIWFSLFHRHGNAGRNRARGFIKKFDKITDLNEAKIALSDYLKDNKNGNTHQHSYRTMLLQELIKDVGYDPALKLVSQSYSKLLERYTSSLEINTICPTVYL